MEHSYPIDCVTAPKFYEFSNSFQAIGPHACESEGVTGVGIYGNSIMTQNTLRLDLVTVGDKFVVQVNHVPFYSRPFDYDFYIGVNIGSSGLKKLIYVSGQSQFWLRVPLNYAIVPPVEFSSIYDSYTIDCQAPTFFRMS